MIFQRICKPSSSTIQRTETSPSWVPRSLAVRALPTSDRPLAEDGAANEALRDPSRGFGHNFANVPVNLPSQLKAGVERLSGLSMDDVKVYYNSAAPRRLRAEAYASGTEIHVAAGRERHLPHEAWHVVQQKQGRVGPADAHVKGASVNEDPGLEGEADRMGAAALQANPQEDVQHDHQWTASRGVPRQVIQPKKVSTDFGEFETTTFADLPSNSGVEIVLMFNPDKAKVDATKIALVQSVKATNEAKKAYAINPTMAGRMVKSGTAAGYVIDASGEFNNPLYFDINNLGPADDLKDTPAPASTPAVVGTNTHYDFGYCYKVHDTDADKSTHPAGLADRPEGLTRKGAGMTFETTALAIDGADKYKYYGSVKWGYTIAGTAAAPTVNKTDIDRASKGTPTANFIAAAKLWNVGKTRGTLVVNPTSPGNPRDAYAENVADGKGLRLAKGTKLKQLAVIKGTTEGMIRAEVLDGTDAGKTVLIYVADVKDMGDGAPNKKLPER